MGEYSKNVEDLAKRLLSGEDVNPRSAADAAQLKDLLGNPHALADLAADMLINNQRVKQDIDFQGSSYTVDSDKISDSILRSGYSGVVLSFDRGFIVDAVLARGVGKDRLPDGPDDRPVPTPPPARGGTDIPDGVVVRANYDRQDMQDAVQQAVDRIASRYTHLPDDALAEFKQRLVDAAMKKIDYIIDDGRPVIIGDSTKDQGDWISKNHNGGVHSVDGLVSTTVPTVVGKMKLDPRYSDDNFDNKFNSPSSLGNRVDPEIATLVDGDMLDGADLNYMGGSRDFDEDSGQYSATVLETVEDSIPENLDDEQMLLAQSMLDSFSQDGHMQGSMFEQQAGANNNVGLTNDVNFSLS